MTPKEQAICAKYSARDKDGLVHCKECPLGIDDNWAMCKANSHYDRHKREWVFNTPKNCSTCKWLVPFSDVCVNGDSPHRADFVNGYDTCDRWEEADDKSRDIRRG